MSDIAIRVENLGKQYRIGGAQRRHKTFQDALLYSLAAPARWLRGERNPIETFWALDDISFEIKQGEAVGIIGRNGAGKSTLLKILSRITKPTKGRIDLYGRVASLLEVGTGFHSELSGRDNIYLNGAILGMGRKEIDRKFDEIVDFSGVEKFLDTPVKHYSSGMYIRLAFAVAAHLEPEILIVDEVLAVGDAEFQKKCLGKMGEVAEGGRTVLFVSHNMLAVKRLCKRGIYIKNGCIGFDGSIDETVEHYTGVNNSVLWASFGADPSKQIKLRHLEIANAEGDEIETAKGILIRMTYDINAPVRSSHVLLRINRADGETLLSTGDADADPERIYQTRQPGQYQYEVYIPPSILGAGHYTVTWSAGVPYQVVYDRVPDALAFRVVDNVRGMSELYHQNRPGMLALDLKWQNATEQTRQ